MIGAIAELADAVGRNTLGPGGWVCVIQGIDDGGRGIDDSVILVQLSSNEGGCSIWRDSWRECGRRQWCGCGCGGIVCHRRGGGGCWTSCRTARKEARER